MMVDVGIGDSQGCEQESSSEKGFGKSGILVPWYSLAALLGSGADSDGWKRHPRAAMVRVSMAPQAPARTVRSDFTEVRGPFRAMLRKKDL